MEQTNTPATPQGKGLGVAGFVISLVCIVIFWIISPIAVLAAAAGGGMGLAMFWLILSILGTVLSIMGMNKLGKTGGKKGLALTGMILGIVSVLLSVWLVFGVKKVHDTVGDAGKELLNTIGQGMKEGMEQAMDSLKKEIESMPADSISVE